MKISTTAFVLNVLGLVATTFGAPGLPIPIHSTKPTAISLESVDYDYGVTTPAPEESSTIVETTTDDDNDSLVDFLLSYFPNATKDNLGFAIRKRRELNDTAGHYNLVVTGSEIKDGNYFAYVRDDRIELEEIEVAPSVTTAEPAESTPPASEVINSDTNPFIEKASEGINTVELSILQYKTQLNLNSLKVLLPQLKEIEEELKQLQSSGSDVDAYARESQLLESRLVATEDKLVRTRAVEKQANPLSGSILQKYNEVHASLRSILQSQIEILE